TVILKEGEASYVILDGTRNRWGDYMGIARDPAQPGAVWALVEYAKAPSNTWGTWVAGLTHLYAASGVVREASTQNPVEFATVEVVETGRVFKTDSTGAFSFASPVENVTINVSAFSYRDTSFTKSFTLYNPDTFDIELQPQIVSTISGQVLDPGGSGVESELVFYAQGNPNPGPYATVLTDPNGNYTLPTILGTYDIHVHPASPHAFQIERFVVLNPSPLTYDIVVSPADIMLVDDDASNNYETYFTATFDSLDKTYHRWDIQVDGLPTAAIRNAYPDKLIVWFTGDSSANPISPAEQDEILDHITTGGKIFLTGQDIAEKINGSALLDTLGISFIQNTTTTIIRGVLGDEITNGLIMILNGTGSANNQTSGDVINIEDTLTTTPIFYYGGGTGSPAGAKFTNDQFHSRAVFLGFGFEGINDVSKRIILMERTIEYLELPFTGIGNNLTSVIPEKFELFQNFPNPFNPETTIKFAVPKLSRVKIVIYNSLGQEVRKLTDEEYNPGTYKIIWNGRDDLGLPVASGVYFYRMTTNQNNNFIKKLLLLK
ncbi:MAG: carboxypeptidase-like regulatory domain-containing protein, partial [Calditrichia bacterium]